MQTGKVKFFLENKGYGFIKADDDGKEYFTHISGFGEGTESLKEGDSVSFNLEEGKKGLNAVDVVKI